MVNHSLSFPQIPILFLGASAALVFVLVRLFKISNSTMALWTATAFIIVLVFTAFEEPVLVLLNTINIRIIPLLGELFPSLDFLNYEPGAKLLALIAYLLGFLVSIYSAEYLNLDRRQHTFYPLLLLMLSGLVGMLYTAHLFHLYLFCELISICAYALVAYRYQTETAIEAGFKYLIMGSVASVMMLLGIAFIFLVKGSVVITNLNPAENNLILLGLLFILSGMSLKSALVPLHTWLPDAHGRAPSSISAILSGILVQSVFYVMIKTLLKLGLDQVFFGTVLLFLSFLNILVGNLMGLVQTNTKRLLGYSTIAQMGYIAISMAIGLRTGNLLALQTGFFIIAAHAISKSLAFLSKGVFHYYLHATTIQDLQRSSQLGIFTALTFSAAIIGLSGIPPFPGFTSKWFLLTSIFTSGDSLITLSALMVLFGALIALGYYLKLVILVFSKLAQEAKGEMTIEKKQHVSFWMSIPLTALVMLMLFISFNPQYLLSLTEEAAQFILGLRG